MAFVGHMRSSTIARRVGGSILGRIPWADDRCSVWRLMAGLCCPLWRSFRKLFLTDITEAQPNTDCEKKDCDVEERSYLRGGEDGDVETMHGWTEVPPWYTYHVSCKSLHDVNINSSVTSLSDAQYPPESRFVVSLDAIGAQRPLPMRSSSVLSHEGCTQSCDGFPSGDAPEDCSDPILDEGSEVPFYDGGNVLIDDGREAVMIHPPKGVSTNQKRLLQYRAATGLRRALLEAVRERAENIPGVCLGTDLESTACVSPANAKSTTDSRVAVLFSGGVDSTVLALLLDRCLPDSEEIDLLSVGFGDNAPSVPDRVSSVEAYAELRNLAPKRQWNLILVDVSREEQEKWKGHIRGLAYPRATVMDFTIASALWFAARGEGHLYEPPSPTQEPATPVHLKSPHNETEKSPQYSQDIPTTSELEIYPPPQALEHAQHLSHPSNLLQPSHSPQAAQSHPQQSSHTQSSHPHQLSNTHTQLLPASAQTRSAPPEEELHPDSTQRPPPSTRHPNPDALENEGVVSHSHDDTARATMESNLALGRYYEEQKRVRKLHIQQQKELRKARHKQSRRPAERVQGRHVSSGARVLFSGLGADEQMAGYKARHITRFEYGGWSALNAELEMDLRRLWRRNLGRDDRIVSDHGKEVRFPFLAEGVIGLLARLPLWVVCELPASRSLADDRIEHTRRKQEKVSAAKPTDHVRMSEESMDRYTEGLIALDRIQKTEETTRLQTAFQIGAVEPSRSNQEATVQYGVKLSNQETARSSVIRGNQATTPHDRKIQNRVSVTEGTAAPLVDASGRQDPRRSVGDIHYDTAEDDVPGDKMVLRRVAWREGLHVTSRRAKKAIQFGSKSARAFRVRTSGTAMMTDATPLVRRDEP
eukprot:Rmarinus@m.16841